MSKINFETLETFTFVVFGVVFVMMMINTSIKRKIDDEEDVIIGILGA